MENLQNNPSLLDRLVPEFRQVLEQPQPNHQNDRIREILARHQFITNLTLLEIVDLADFFAQKYDLISVVRMFSEANVQEIQQPQSNS